MRGLVLLLASVAFGQTADEIADRVVAASGKFGAVESMRLRGRMKFGAGNFGPIVVSAKRPSKFRTELTVGPDHVTQAYDGAIGWQTVVGEHNQTPTALKGAALAHLIDQAVNAIGGPLFDRKVRHNQVELMGREKVDGVDCYRLELTLGTGDKMTIFVNAGDYRVNREELSIDVNGVPAVIEETIGNYRQYGPVRVACLFITRQRGGEEQEGQRLEFDTVEINPVLEDSIFQLPGRP
jgi:hypothetical protein